MRRLGFWLADGNARLRQPPGLVRGDGLRRLASGASGFCVLLVVPPFLVSFSFLLLISSSLGMVLSVGGVLWFYRIEME